jgi:protein involved in polysaccharide export with SLBB domain
MMKRLCICLFVFFMSSIAMVSAQTDESSTQKKSQAEMFQAINVTVGGEFVVTGSFTASRMQRIDHFITTLYNQAQERAIGSIGEYGTIRLINRELKRYPLRNIILKRASGDQLKIDLLKFRSTGDFKNNPYLMNDDVIIFPSYDKEKNVIDISGAVNRPVKFQFVEGDRLSDAILFAGGIDSSYDHTERAEISRLNNSGDKEELFSVNTVDGFILKSGDRVRIMADENKKKNYKILILGEVKNPGYIYVMRGGSPIEEVIRKAGGFTANADLRRAEVIRELNPIEKMRRSETNLEYLEETGGIYDPDTQAKLQQQRDALRILRLSNFTAEDSLNFGVDSRLTVMRSENLVDFTKLKDPDSEDSKFLVKEGDLILVPTKFDYVYVFGAVSKAGYVQYTPEKDYRYYIEKAGGLAEIARDGSDDVYIIKGKELNWVTKDKKDIQIEPGDYIYIPKKVTVSGWTYVKRIGDILGIAGSIATVILLFIQFGK